MEPRAHRRSDRPERSAAPKGDDCGHGIGRKLEFVVLGERWLDRGLEGCGRGRVRGEKQESGHQERAC